MRPGGILEVAAARHVAAIIAGDAVDTPDNFKFLCEAVIASGVQPEPSPLNRSVGDILFATSHRARLLRNPRRCAMYALPLIFLRDPPPGSDSIATLFLDLHRAGAVQAASYPEYRNVEMDYVAARLSGRTFWPPSLDRFALAFGWMTRDHCYGLTHLLLYACDFGRSTLTLADDEIAMIEALIAAADQRGDVDLMLELILCHAAVANAGLARKAFYAAVAADSILPLLDRLESDPDRFAALYHPLFVGWMHNAIGVAPVPSEIERARHARLGAVMSAFADGDPVTAIAAAHDLFAAFGPHPVIARLVDFQGTMLARAMDEVSAAA